MNITPTLTKIGAGIVLIPYVAVLLAVFGIFGLFLYYCLIAMADYTPMM